jgi:uncharacterized protein
MPPPTETALNPGSSTASRGWWISLGELVLGSFLVIGHNVYHIVPNEVVLLFLIGWLSLRLRDGGWNAAGLRRPDSWKWTILIAFAAAALRILLGELVVNPLTAEIFPPQAHAAVFDNLTGNVKQALMSMGLVWSFAAFGEELGYRGYLLTRAADLGSRSRGAYWMGMLLVSALFGIGHFYKGPAGVIDSGIAGLILGGAYLLSRRNLWVAILAHGLIDTCAVVVIFFGWAD